MYVCMLCYVRYSVHATWYGTHAEPHIKVDTHTHTYIYIHIYIHMMWVGGAQIVCVYDLSVCVYNDGINIHTYIHQI
jgi:hypothetical protein